MSKIVIIEDRFELRMLMRSFLARKGHEVIDAKNGVDALRLIKKDHPDVIITDILMPEKDGFDTIEELRKNGSDIPIVIVTGYDNPLSQDKARELGVIRVLLKPFSDKDLITAVDEAIKVGKSASYSLA